METLFRDDRNVSEQAMKAAQARYRSELARQAAADQVAASIRDAIRGTWGETVTGWATNPDSPTIQSLLQQKAFLVQLVFPYDMPRTTVRGKVVIAPTMARGPVVSELSAQCTACGLGNGRSRERPLVTL